MTEQPGVAMQHTEEATIASVEQPEFASDVIDFLLAEFRRRLDAGGPAGLVLDLSRVRFIDSVSLGALVVLLRRVKQANGRLALVGLSGHAMKVLQVTGLEKVFELFEEVSAALEDFRRGA